MTRLTLSVGDRRVSGMYSQAAEPIATLVFAHGAGGDMHHRTMAAISKALLGMGIATLRFNFPFREDGRARVDSQAVSIAAVKAAVEFAIANYRGPLFLGGHSFGGRGSADSERVVRTRRTPNVRGSAIAAPKKALRTLRRGKAPRLGRRRRGHMGKMLDVPPRTLLQRRLPTGALEAAHA